MKLLNSLLEKIKGSIKKETIVKISDYTYIKVPWSDGVQLIYNGDSDIIDYIPSYIDGKPVRSLRCTFQNKKNIKKVTAKIPDTVTDIIFAFCGCESLICTPYIPNWIEDMTYSFADCTNLQKITNLPSCLEIMKCTFSNCSKLETTCFIPDSVNDMISTFYNCTSLKYVKNLPKRLRYAHCTFCHCTELNRPQVPDNLKPFIQHTTFFGVKSNNK
jgi:hypothetical protein